MSASPASQTGSPLGSGTFCAACGAPLASGARFCHRCGTPAGEGMPASGAGAAVAPAAATGSGLASVLPWGVAFVALMAVVAMLAGQNFGAERGSAIDGSANALPTPSIDGPAFGGGGPGGGAGAPDISNMSPEQRADALFVRIMTYNDRGQRDSVALFAQMALPAHELLQNINLDRRYHAALIAEAAGVIEIAAAQADTILSTDTNHLLGLVLSIRLARNSADADRTRTLEQQLLRVADTELARQLTEYEQHRGEIDAALAAARSAGAP